MIEFYTVSSKNHSRRYCHTGKMCTDNAVPSFYSVGVLLNPLIRVWSKSDSIILVILQKPYVMYTEGLTWSCTASRFMFQSSWLLVVSGSSATRVRLLLCRFPSLKPRFVGWIQGENVVPCSTRPYNLGCNPCQCTWWRSVCAQTSTSICVWLGSTQT